MDALESLDDHRGLGDRLKRYTTVSTSAVGILARLLGEGYLGVSTDHEGHAQSLRSVLGDLKGPLMKAAQLLSTIPGALPEAYTHELSFLQSNAPPMGRLFVNRRMRQELGVEWQSKFRSFSMEATAAASLGQVHKAVHLDGTPLAYKLQYPDMESTIRDDLYQLKLMLSLYEKVSNALNTEDIFIELKERLFEELDYLQEARHIRLYQKILTPLEFVHIPRVYEDLSTRRLLTMSWLEGRSIAQSETLSQEDRNQIAQRMFQIWYYPFYTYGFIHGDPHLGNYTIQDDLTINLLDFGCIRLFHSSFVQGVIDLYHALLKNDEALAVHAYETWGFKNLNKNVLEALTIWARFLFDPLLDDRVRTIHSHHGDRYGRDIASQVHHALHKAGGVRPPREFVMMDRAAVGMGAVFMRLHAQLNWHRAYEDLIADFNKDALEKRQKDEHF